MAGTEDASEDSTLEVSPQITSSHQDLVSSSKDPVPTLPSSLKSPSEIHKRCLKGPSEACIFVANLPHQYSNDELADQLYKIFSEYGTILFIKASRDRRGRPYGFVQYQRVEDANQAFSSTEHSLGNRLIRMERAKCIRTFLIHISSQCMKEETLKTLCERYGSLQKFQVKEKACDENTQQIKLLVAEVSYLHRSDAVDAFKELRALYPDWIFHWISSDPSLEHQGLGSSYDKKVFERFRKERYPSTPMSLFQSPPWGYSYPPWIADPMATQGNLASWPWMNLEKPWIPVHPMWSFVNPEYSSPSLPQSHDVTYPGNPPPSVAAPNFPFQDLPPWQGMMPVPWPWYFPSDPSVVAPSSQSSTHSNDFYETSPGENDIEDLNHGLHHFHLNSADSHYPSESNDGYPKTLFKESNVKDVHTAV